MPDRIIASLRHSPTALTTTETITFTAVLKNIEAGAAATSTMAVKVGGETPGAAGTIFGVPALTQTQPTR